MEKELFLKYVEMLHRFENLAKDESSIYSTTNEIEIMNHVRSLVKDNPELMELLKTIHALPDEQRKQAVEEYFSKEETKEEEEEPKKSEEEEIAKTFGVDVNNIDHKYLSNGNEIYSFYASNLGRQVILENNTKGKSLMENLKDIQDSNKKYQTENAEENTNSILDDKLKENLELEMLSKDEIIKIYGDFENLEPEVASKLRFLIKNYEQLDIKGINVENLIYIDSDNQIHEVVLNDKKEVTVSSTEGENESGPAFEETNDNIEKEEDDKELDSMLEEEPELEKEEEKALQEEKPLVLVKKDNQGFLNNVLFMAVITTGILLIGLIATVIKYYS